MPEQFEIPEKSKKSYFPYFVSYTPHTHPIHSLIYSITSLSQMEMILMTKIKVATTIFISSVLLVIIYGRQLCLLNTWVDPASSYINLPSSYQVLRNETEPNNDRIVKSKCCQNSSQCQSNSCPSSLKVLRDRV